MSDAQKAMPHVWSVSELTIALKRTIESSFAIVDVEGEVSGFRCSDSGHAYWTLKDENSTIATVMFRSALDACAAKSAIRDGARVKVRGRLTTGPRSQYQIVVSRLRLLGEGELMQRYLALREKLTKEGLFDSSRKRPLPFLPRRIGIITSFSGAVIHDICRVILRRFPTCDLRLYPTLVQGDSAPASLIAGLEYFNNATDWKADVIIFGRGGGNFEELFCFNDEAFVRAVASSRIPTISAVGHETDFSLADFAADIRAGTPSMAAEIVVPELARILQTIASAESSLVSSLRSAYEWTAQKTDALANDLSAALWHYEQNSRLKVETLANSLEVASANLRASCDNFAHQLATNENSMSNALAMQLVKAESNLESLATKLNLLSPYSVLNRGYSLTTDIDGMVIRDATKVAPGTTILTKLQNGTLTSISQ